MNRKVVLATLLTCLFVLTMAYPLTEAGERDKIYLLMSPNPHAGFYFSESETERTNLVVWVAVVTDSTYGKARMALVLYETYVKTDDEGWRLVREECHWYTDNLRAGIGMAKISAKIDREAFGIEVQYDVTLARIDVTASYYYVAATVIVRSQRLFSAEFQADPAAEIKTREMHFLPGLQDLSVEAYFDEGTASVDGIEAGELMGIHFDLIDSEIYDPSLLE